MKSLPTSQKLRGGYYTPREITEFITEWAIRSPNDKILEPGCGDGNFLVDIVRRLAKLGKSRELIDNQITGIELLESEALKATERVRALGVKGNAIQVMDFIEYSLSAFKNDTKFNVVIGNPPFIRYQNFDKIQQKYANEIANKAKLHHSKLTNAWVYFVIGSTLLLSDHGRLGMVIPAELLQVGYASELRKFLIDNYSRILMVTFKKLVIQEVQEEVVILLCEKNGNERIGMRTLELEDASQLRSIGEKDIATIELKPIDHTSDKWTQYFLDVEEIMLLRRISKDPTFKRMGEFLEVDVGIVTGQNDFFIVNRQEVNELGLGKYVTPMLTRTFQTKGAKFSKEEWKKNVNSNSPTYLLDLRKYQAKPLPSELAHYIKSGEDRNLHTGYKCRIRDPWWVVPSIWIPDAFLVRQVHEFPRLILNETNASCTDTIHRVKNKGYFDLKQLIPVFYNSLTFAHSEIVGRSYGGGVLELEPREAENLILPFNEGAELNLDKIDKLIRERNINEMLDYTDKILLQDLGGLTRDEVIMLRNTWEKLKNRRLARKARGRGRVISR